MKIVTIDKFEKELCNFLRDYKVTFKGNSDLLNIYGKTILHWKDGVCQCVESQIRKKISDMK